MRHELQRLFSTFPRGWPGVGLLLLRAVVGVTVTLQGSYYLANGDSPAVLTVILALLMIVAGVSLVVGLLTPVAGVVTGLSAASVTLGWCHPPTPNLFDAKLSTVLVVVVAASVVLLGPGSISLDARIFGRREIIIPPRVTSR